MGTIGTTLVVSIRNAPGVSMVARRLAVTVVLVLGLALSTVAPAVAMTQEQAGTYYLVGACRVNAADAHLTRVLLRGHKSFRAKDVRGKRRLRNVRRALARDERANAKLVSTTVEPALGVAVNDGA